MFRRLPRTKRRSKPLRTPRAAAANFVRKESIAFLRRNGEGLRTLTMAPRGTRLRKPVWLRLGRERGKSLGSVHKALKMPDLGPGDGLPSAPVLGKSLLP